MVRARSSVIVDDFLIIGKMAGVLGRLSSRSLRRLRSSFQGAAVVVVGGVSLK